jgi:hypothetical protein
MGAEANLQEWAHYLSLKNTDVVVEAITSELPLMRVIVQLIRNENPRTIVANFSGGLRWMSEASFRVVASISRPRHRISFLVSQDATHNQYRSEDLMTKVSCLAGLITRNCCLVVITVINNLRSV